MARGRIYTAVFNAVSVSAVQDFFRISAPADSSVVIHELEISCLTTTSEVLKLMIHRGSTDGSGGTTPTATPKSLGDAAFGGSVGVNNTTQSTDGTILRVSYFNLLSGYFWVPTPETQDMVSPSARWVAALEVAPSSAVTMSGTVTFEEIGG